MFFDAIRKGSYECYLKPDTLLPMMHIKDCLRFFHQDWKFLKSSNKIFFRSLLEFMTVPEEKLKHRVYNVTAMSFTPEELVDKIAKYVPELRVSYKPDSRQAIADSWPQILDDTEARCDWGWKHEYDIDRLVADMMSKVTDHYKRNGC